MTSTTSPADLVADTVRSPSMLPGAAYGLLAAATFGSSGATARPLLSAGWTPGAVVLLRIGAACAILIGPALLAMRGRWRLLRQRIGLLLIFGLLAVAGAQLCYFNAVQHVSIGVALLLEYSGILLVVGWLWLRTRVRPPALTFAGAAVALVGLALVLDVFGGTHLSLIGVLWGLGAAVGLAVYFVLAARTEDGLPPLVVVTTGMLVGTIGLAIAGLTGVMPMRAATTDVQLAGVTLSWMVPAAWLCVMTAAVAYLSGVASSRRLGSTMASFFGLTEVLFAVLFAWLLLGEIPAAIQLAGGVLVLGGVVLVRLGELRRPPARPTAAGVIRGEVTGGR